jgi:hypothetical protein
MLCSFLRHHWLIQIIFFPVSFLREKIWNFHVIKHHTIRFYQEEETCSQPCLLVTNVHRKSLRYLNPLDRRLGRPQSGCDKNWAICVSTTKINPNPQFFNPQPSHLHEWAQVCTAENGQNGVHVCVWVYEHSLICFRWYACVHTYVFILLRVCVRTRHAYMSFIIKWN